jgi:hypothetical protein
MRHILLSSPKRQFVGPTEKKCSTVQYIDGSACFVYNFALYFFQCYRCYHCEVRLQIMSLFVVVVEPR